MSPPPEYDKEPKAPDKSVTNLTCEETKALHNLVNDQQTNSDNKSSSTAASTEVESQRPEDFMDDEDRSEYGIAPRYVQTHSEFSGQKRPRQRQFHDGPIPEHTTDLQASRRGGRDTFVMMTERQSTFVLVFTGFLTLYQDFVRKSGLAPFSPADYSGYWRCLTVRHSKLNDHIMLIVSMHPQPEDYRLAEIVDADGEIRDAPPAPPQKPEPDGSLVPQMSMTLRISWKGPEWSTIITPFVFTPPALILALAPQDFIARWDNQVKIMLPWDQQGKNGPKKPQPDHILVTEPL